MITDERILMKVILAAIAQVGHLNPILAVGRMLGNAGHEVVVFTGKIMKDHVEAHGMRFAPLPPDADHDLRDLGALFPERQLIPPGPDQLRFDFERVFVDPISAQYKGLSTLLQQFAADVIVHDSMFGGCLPFLLGAYAGQRPRIASLGVTFLPTMRDDGAPMGLGLPPASSDAQSANYAELARQVDAAFGHPIKQRADALLATLGAGPLPASFTDSLVMLPDVYFQPAVPGFEYPSRAQPEGVRFIGALPLPAQGEVPIEFVVAVAMDKRIVLVTQGTVANRDLSQLVGPTIEAMCGDDDVMVFATTGGRPLDSLPEAPSANAHISEFLQFAKILPHVDVLVTNGGYGTVTHALRAGVPVIVAGATEDKPEVAARVAWAGCGINLGTDTPPASALKLAINEVLSDGSYRQRAQTLATEFSRYDAAALITKELTTLVASHRESRQTPAGSRVA